MAGNRQPQCPHNHLKFVINPGPCRFKFRRVQELTWVYVVQEVMIRQNTDSETQGQRKMYHGVSASSPMTQCARMCKALNVVQLELQVSSQKAENFFKPYGTVHSVTNMLTPNIKHLSTRNTSGNRVITANYRPISLTSTPSKLLVQS